MFEEIKRTIYQRHGILLERTGKEVFRHDDRGNKIKLSVMYNEEAIEDLAHYYDDSETQRMIWNDILSLFVDALNISA